MDLTPNVFASQIYIGRPPAGVPKKAKPKSHVPVPATAPLPSRHLNGREARFYHRCLGRQWIQGCRDCSQLFDLLDSYRRKSGTIYVGVKALAHQLGWSKRKTEKRLAQLETSGLLTNGRLTHERGTRYRVLHPDRLKWKKLPPWPRDLRPSESVVENAQNQMGQNVEACGSASVGPCGSATSNRADKFKKEESVRTKAAAEPKTAAALWKRLSQQQRQEYILQAVWDTQASENYPTTLSEIARLAGLHRRRVKPVLAQLADPDYPNGVNVSENGKWFRPVTPEDPDWDEYFACGVYELETELVN